MRISPLTLFILIITFPVLIQCSSGDNKTSKPSTINRRSGEKTFKESPLSSPTEIQPHQTGRKTLNTNNTEIGKNHPPEVKEARIIIDNTGDPPALSADVKLADQDEDDLSLEYKWYINGEFVSSENRLESFKRGDKILLRVTPFDGKDYGSPKTLIFNVKNFPPEILPNNEVSLVNDNTYRYTIKAFDRDGDSLTFKLTKGPEGMTIDPETGVILWRVEPGFTGSFPVEVTVDDGHGGKTNFKFEASLTASPTNGK